MASAPGSNVYLAVFIDDDESVGDFAVVHADGRLIASGNAAQDLVEVARQSCAEQWVIHSLGGLDAFRRAAAVIEDSALSGIVKAHKDAAYDFLVDNGYNLTWESLFGTTSFPQTATDAARSLAAWFTTAETTGVVKRKTVAGNDSYWPLVVHTTATPSFRTVQEALTAYQTTPPDQSWMTGDTKVNISAETQWMF